MNDPLLIGVDGGGSQCRARIAHLSGRALGEGLGGPANARLDPPLVINSILTACRAAASAAGLTESDWAGAHIGLGLAGAGQKTAVARLLAEPNPFGSVTVETDAYAAWLGAHGGKDGAILIAGTGSCGFAVVGGAQLYVSGWGAEVSDEASGMWLGREAIRRTLWAYDGRAAPSPLTDALLAKHEGSPEKIVAFATHARPADYARYVPLILAHAERRDPLAMALITEAARDAAQIMTRLIEFGAANVCFLGGIADVLRPWLPPPLQAHLVAPAGDAMDGAILMARQARDGAAPIDRMAEPA